MKQRQKNQKNSPYEYWQSYSDMMAALLLMFILIMSATLLQTYAAYEEKVEQSKKIEEQKQELDRLLGIKPELIADLKQELSDFQVDIDESTGDIMFESDILFDYNQAELKENGINFLNGFMPKYLNVLFNDKYNQYIAEIIIEGHTDQKGSYISNLELSQRRAQSVAEFCLGDNSIFAQNIWLERLRKIVTVSGKSFMEPVYVPGSTSEVDQEKSRRVEVKFRLKDDETIREFEKLLE